MNDTQWLWLLLVVAVMAFTAGVLVMARLSAPGRAEAYRAGYLQRIRDVGEVEGTPPWLLEKLADMDGSPSKGGDDGD